MARQINTRRGAHKRRMKISAVRKLTVLAGCLAIGYSGVSTVLANPGTDGSNGVNASDTTHNPAVATGGNGGLGSSGTYQNGGGNGGNGGMGGNAFAAISSGIPSAPFVAANTATAQAGYGGLGGSGYNSNFRQGLGGASGNAVAGINIGTAANPYVGSIIGGGAYATDGIGGSGYIGGTGGNATIAPSAIYATGNILLTTSAGAGTSSRGILLGVGGTGSLFGGNGGTASLPSVPIFGQSTDGGYVNVSADLSGGAGGYGNGATSTGGNGASETIGSSGSSAVLGSTTGALTLSQGAQGGDAGGSQDIAGKAGDASSILDLNLNTLSNVLTPSSLTVHNGATGGYGGPGGGMGLRANGSDGGTSYAESTIAAPTGIKLTVAATGGSGAGTGTSAAVGNGGDGAIGTALAAGTVTNNGNLLITSTGTGGGGGFGAAGNGGQGANGTAVADGAGGGSGNVSVTSSGYGGNGGEGITTGGFAPGNGGSATATSDGVGSGTGTVTVRAYAYGGSGGVSRTLTGQQQGRALVDGSFGSATAMATATGLASNNVNASAFASSGYSKTTVLTLGSGPALADAYATGLGGSSVANSYSAGGAVSVTALASAPVISGATAHAESFAITMGPTRSSPDANGIQAVAYASALPSNSDANAALAGSPNVRGNFNVGGNGTGPVSDVVGLMTLATNNMSTGSATTYHSEADWTINPAQLAHGQQNILVGLLNASSSGTGTVSFVVNFNGTLTTGLNDASFAAADAFFTDNTLNLGAVGNFPFIVNFLLDVTPTSNGATFDPNIIFGNATMGAGPAAPEPAGLAWMIFAGAGMLLLPGRRRINI